MGRKKERVNVEEKKLCENIISEVGQRKGTLGSRDLLEGQDKMDRTLRYSS